jgi:glycosyltransferase involved in cell wall biosynthesis
MRLAVIATHPIQYHSPVFCELASRGELELRVFYGWEGTANSIDHGFGQRVTWDIPLLEGYDWEFVRNVAKVPGVHHFYGIDLPELNSRLIQWGADAILIYGWSYKSHLAAMRYFKRKVKVLFRGDSTLIDESPGFRKLLRRFYLKRIYRNIDIALAVGTNNKKYYEVLGLRSDQIVLAPHAIDNQRFKVNSSTKAEAAEAWRRRIGIHGDAIVIMFVGKLERKKAPDLLLSAFQQAKLENLHLVFVGSGEMEVTLKSQVQSNKVHFLGFQNQIAMETVYRMADVVVLPSNGPGETWGLALNEAMACGRAVIASNRVGAAIDLVSPGENGWIFQSGNLGDLLEVLIQCNQLGRNGLAEFGKTSQAKIDTFSVEIQVDAIVSSVNLS